jgi:hypothetical protein
MNNPIFHAPSPCYDCRHIFSEKQYVEEYRSQDFPSELGLDRQKLIYLALLLGSDYTEGISGIGIVNAVRPQTLDHALLTWLSHPPPSLPQGRHCLCDVSLVRLYMVGAIFDEW